jgi:hypothetical protein
MTKDEALKMALEKIRAAQKCHSNAVVTLLCEADEIIEEALEKPEKEPIAYINVEERKLEWATKFLKWDVPTTIKISKIPLYTAAPVAQQPCKLGGQCTSKCQHCFPFQQPAPVQEPVAWDRTIIYTPPHMAPPAAKRPWIGLTDIEIQEIWFDNLNRNSQARAIEAKLKERNQ